MTRAASPVDANDFRELAASFASGVTVVTTRTTSGAPQGFTASAFTSVSLDPPLVLVCLDRGADCRPAFDVALSFAISVLREDQRDIALRFATRGIDKFDGTSMEDGPATGAPLVAGAVATIECRVHERLDGGDHVVLVGEVVGGTASGGEPLLYHARRFGRFVPQ